MGKNKKYSKTEEELISFICYHYCQHCENNSCNVNEVMDKYQDNGLTPLQMKEVINFELTDNTCSNHIPNEGFDMLMHKIKIYYKNKNKAPKEMPDWFSSQEISHLWNEEVKYIQVLFSDI
jgi:hypothetical protein